MQIEVLDIPSFISYAYVDSHLYIKSKILNCINNTGICVNDKFQKLRTDYFLTEFKQNEQEPEYFKLFSPVLDEYENKFKQKFGYNKFFLKNYWFQQYEKNDFHTWHGHGECNFSSVYYLELDKESAKTTFRYLNKEFTVDIFEGYIITFPSFLEHCSKLNLGNRKTVIAFNSNIE